MRYLFLIIMVVSISFANSFNKVLFKKTIKNASYKRIVKTSEVLQNSSHLSKVFKKLTLKEIPKIDKLAEIAESIAKKSPIHDRLMNSSYPLKAMSLYAKGGDKLFENIDVLSKKVMNIDTNMISKLQSKFSSMPTVSKMTQKQIIDKTIKVTEATGKFGIKVIKGLADFAMKYPKSAIAGVLFGWYLSDPVGFKEALDEFGGSIADFATHIAIIVGKTIGATASGVTNGFVDSLKENISPQTIYILLGLFLIYLVYKLRSLFNFIKLPQSKSKDRNTNEESPIRVRKQKRKKGRY